MTVTMLHRTATEASRLWVMKESGELHLLEQGIYHGLELLLLVYEQEQELMGELGLAERAWEKISGETMRSRENDGT